MLPLVASVCKAGNFLQGCLICRHGKSDIAIGASRLFGSSILENFNRPILAPSNSEF